MMTEFKINVEQERANIKRDIRAIEKQIAHISDSVEMLYDIKRKTETAKRHQKMLDELKGDNKSSKKAEVQDEIRRLRNDFKHYIRQIWMQQQTTAPD